MEIRIYYEDTDCGNVVYYANYLKYFERARTHYLEERGISVRELLQDGTQFMVVRAHVDYRSPARYGETLWIDTRISERRKAAMTFSHKIRERDSGRLIVEGFATLAAVTLDGKLKRLPQRLIDMPASPTKVAVSRSGKLIKKAFSRPLTPGAIPPPSLPSRSRRAETRLLPLPQSPKTDSFPMGRALPGRGRRGSQTGDVAKCSPATSPSRSPGGHFIRTPRACRDRRSARRCSE